MAYVAQHAFHHLEEHLDTTPLKYMFKRFGLGQDQEDAHKVKPRGVQGACAPLKSYVGYDGCGVCGRWQFIFQCPRAHAMPGSLCLFSH